MTEDETERPLQNDKEQHLSVHIVVGKKREEFDLTKTTFDSDKRKAVLPVALPWLVGLKTRQKFARINTTLEICRTKISVQSGELKLVLCSHWMHLNYMHQWRQRTNFTAPDCIGHLASLVLWIVIAHLIVIAPWDVLLTAHSHHGATMTTVQNDDVILA